MATATTMEKDKFKYRVEIQQMMFVSGETGEPNQETTGIIEEIVRGQVIEMLQQCTQLALRRGSRSISTDDLIFLIRHDRAKVSRLRTYLSWKDVRKTAKDQDPAGGAAADPGDIMDDIAAPAASGAQMMKQKKTKVGLPWEVASFFNEMPPEREDDEDEDEMEANAATLQRLKNADERTRGMTRDEYVHWSECRQASFTFRKSKRFREWAGFGIVTEAKPNDDIVDILGFLTFEIVQTLTEEAIKVKEGEERERKGGAAGRKRKRPSGEVVKKETLASGDKNAAAAGEKDKDGGDKTEGGGGDGDKTDKKEVAPIEKKSSSSDHKGEWMFSHQEGRQAIEARHVSEAFRRLQTMKPKTRAMRNFNGGVMKSRLSLV